MQQFRINYNSIADLRRKMPEPVNGDISIIIEHANFLELLRGYERYIEYTKTLIELEILFQKKINMALNNRVRSGDLRDKLIAGRAEKELRKHKNFITAILGD